MNEVQVIAIRDHQLFVPAFIFIAFSSKSITPSILTKFIGHFKVIEEAIFPHSKFMRCTICNSYRYSRRRVSRWGRDRVALLACSWPYKHRYKPRASCHEKCWHFLTGAPALYKNILGQPPPTPPLSVLNTLWPRRPRASRSATRGRRQQQESWRLKMWLLRLTAATARQSGIQLTAFG